MIEMQFADASAFVEGLLRWATVALPQFVAALVLLLVGLWLAGRAARAVGHLIDNQRTIDPTLRGLLTALVRYAIIIVVLIAVLGQVGIQTTSILAALGAAGLAIGLALQGTLSNIAAGIMLLWLRPFRIDDYIDAGGVAGTVKEVGLFATEMHTWDGLYQFVPNSELWNKRVINYSRLPYRLVEVKFGIAYDDNIELGRQVLLQLAGGDGRVLRDPAPIVFVSTLGSSAVELSLRVWSSGADYWPLLRMLNEAGKIALENAGLSIPFPQTDVHHKGLAEAFAGWPSGTGGPT